ncbi:MULTISPECIES: hypothetical protein [Cetobacterium]|jgi:hypothetical protein|uniref:Uncharacterized protein n=1 Tax=Candidatus Cetobacterium colombiensis TaxID=3073100 RepID=A0ABU4WAE4_9FUSO|nr:hypothetical protein [Candidatus Cetobacterium colombiensis]MDX8335992.1 hypothetical protein [Candidatus Cetobacterium colombiensis]
MPKITVANTGEVIKNRLYLINLIDDFHYNLQSKEEKINYILNFNLNQFPAFLRDDLVHIEAEQELEKHRSEFFPKLPSRCGAQFAFEKLGDLLTAAKMYGWKGTIYKISIDTSEEYVVSKHNADIISTIRKSDFKSITHTLKDYWTGEIKWEKCHDRDLHFLPTTEYLIEGKINIIETLDKTI